MVRFHSSLGRAGTIVFIGSVVILVLIISIGIFAPLFSGLDPMAQSLRDRYQPPSSEHLLGTDALGRDVLARVIFGARTSLGIAIAAASISALLGAMVGFLSGFVGGTLDTVTTRLVDILMAFPMVLLAIIIITVMGSGIINLILAIVVSSLPRFVRLARSVALSIRESDFILASRSIGGNFWWQIVTHVVPNGIPLVIVLATARLGTVILTESSLSFLGLGVPPGTPSWGSMISEGRQVLREAPWLSFAPGLAIMLVVLCFNMLGDGLRDLLDPQMRGSGSGS